MMILHPDDYRRLAETDDLATYVPAVMEMSDAALEAREVADRSGEDRLVEDSAEIEKLLGL
jgi:hypothetical protein